MIQRNVSVVLFLSLTRPPFAGEALWCESGDLIGALFDGRDIGDKHSIMGHTNHGVSSNVLDMLEVKVMDWCYT